MAVAIGERLDNKNRRLWLFRNAKRDLWLADMREHLGQIFFFSTDVIWDQAVADCPLVKPYLSGVSLAWMPTEELWKLDFDEKVTLEQYSIVEKEDMPWESPTKVSIPQMQPEAKIICYLNENEEHVSKNDNLLDDDYAVIDDGDDDDCTIIDDYDDYSTNLEALSDITGASLYNPEDRHKGLEKINDYCGRISDAATAISEQAEDLLWEDSMSESEYDNLISSLDNSLLDLQGTLKIIESNH
jgi:hypothetical protein